MEWLEPEVAEPRPGVTGFPIESPPEEAARRRRRVDTESNGSVSPSDTPLNGDASAANTPIHLKLALKTPLTDELRRDSSIRRSGRHRSPLNYYEQAKADLGIERRSASPPSRSLTSRPPSRDSRPQERKPKNGGPTIKLRMSRRREGKESIVSAQASAPEVKEESAPLEPSGDQKIQIINKDYCAACGGGGNFVCCETCPRSYHFTCVDPPLDDSMLPDGAWYCRQCEARRKPPIPFEKSLFSDLLNLLDRTNPRQFKLPTGLQTMFEGVSAGPDGTYIDEYMLPPKKSKDSDESRRLEDKNGDIIACFKCHQTALQGPMATCDKCQTAWHVDCIDPPVQSIPNRWVCPNHPEKAARLRRRPRKPTIVESNLSRGLKNDGLIEIADEDSDYGPVREVPFLNIYNTEAGVAAPVVKKRSQRLFEGDNGVVYRLPAQSIKLDFIELVHKINERTYSDSNEQRLLVALDEIAAQPDEKREAVRDLMYLKLQGPATSAAQAHENLLRIADAAVHADDEAQYAAIKRLIELKGRDKLMAFLTS